MVEIHPLDNVWVQVKCDDSIAHELNDYFTFEAKGAAFMRRQARFRKWDGKIRLFKLKYHTIYRGLVSRIIEFCEQQNYSVTNYVPVPHPLLPGTEFDNWLSTVSVPHELRGYQRSALDTLLQAHRGVILSPTGSGKSFIIYLLTCAVNTKTLIVVPTIGLVSQMAHDFKSYGFDLKNLHTIQAGSQKNAEAGIYVSTWQSIYKLEPEYFSQFGCIIVDEVHQAKSKSLTHLLEKATDTAYRFGFTGTLDDTQAHRLILEGLFGDIVRVATTHELVKAQQLAPLHVRMVMLKYPEQTCKQLKKVQYQDEIDYIVQDQARLEFCARLLDGLKGNALILFNYVEKHGIPLFERIKARSSKQIHYIAGSVDGDEREDIRRWIESDGQDNHVVVASYGTFSTGINAPSLRHIIFGSPSKSKIRVIQSIGRGLRPEAGKVCTLWDLVDDLRIGKHINYAMRHGQIRAEYYANERFPVTIQQVALSNVAALVPQKDTPSTLASSPRNALF